MKKMMLTCLTAALLLTMFGCSNKQNSEDSNSSKTQVSSGSQDAVSSQDSSVSKEDSSSGESTKYAEAVDVLNAIWDAYADDEKFSIAGGDLDHSVMDAPGKFDTSKTDELQITLKLPAEQFDKLEDAASMMHMMNTNSFTGAAYRLKAGTDMNAFASAVKNSMLATQWMCGIPDTVLVIQVGENYVLTAYGLNDFIQPFKTHALSVLENAQVLVEAPIE